MHRPPAVSFQVGRSRWHVCVLMALVLLAATGLGAMAWHAPVEFSWWSVWMQASLLVFAAVCAGRAWLRSPLGILRWDGECWSWEASRQTPLPGLRIVLDFQRVVLVSAQRTGLSPLFLWLEPMYGTPSPAWQALRRALVHATVHGARQALPSAGPDGLMP
jgi:toxin CptA